MKRLLFFAAALFATVACTETEADVDIDDNSSDNTTSTEFSISASIPSVDSDWGLSWSSDDSIGCYTTGTTTINELTMSSFNASTSTFKGEVPADSFRLIYPYDSSAYAYSSGSYAIDYSDQSKVYMVSSSVLATDATSASMSVVGATIELAFVFSNPESDNISISSVTLNDVYSSVTVNLNEDADSSSFVTASSGSSISVDVAGDYITNGSMHSVYIYVPSTVSFDSEISASVKLTNGEDTATLNVTYALDSAVTLSNGDFKSFETDCDLYDILGAPIVYAVWDGSTASSYAGGSGSESDPYQISTGAELSYLRSIISANTSIAGQFFALTDNIDLNNINWEPIGTYFTGQFTGATFDGAGYKIINLSQNTSEFYGGLFGIVQDGNAPIFDDEGEATGEYEFSQAVIKNLSVSGSVSAPYGGAGGIIGSIFSGAYVTNCSFSGSVSSGSSGWDSVGGIVGDAYGSVVQNCYAVAELNSVSSSVCGVGGVVGSDWGGTSIENCYFAGSVTGETNDYCSGVLGFLSSTYSVTNSYSLTGAASGTSGDHGTAMYDDAMQSADFVDTLNANAASIDGACEWFGSETYPVHKF